MAGAKSVLDEAVRAVDNDDMLLRGAVGAGRRGRGRSWVLCGWEGTEAKERQTDPRGKAPAMSKRARTGGPPISPASGAAASVWLPAVLTGWLDVCSRRMLSSLKHGLEKPTS